MRQHRNILFPLILKYCFLLLWLLLLPAFAAGDEEVVTLSVTDFTTHASEDLSFLGKSFSESMTTKLSKIGQIHIYERSQFERIADELKMAQDRAALDVSEALQIRLSGLDREMITDDPTKDLNAYQLYNSALADEERRIDLLESALKRDPDFRQARHLLAESYFAIGALAKADAEYSRLLEASPEDYKALYARGVLSAMLGQNETDPQRQLEYLETALGSLKSFLEIYPNAMNAEEVELNLEMLSSVIVQLKDYIDQQ